MALKRTSSSIFAENGMFERGTEIPPQEGVKMMKIQSCVAELVGSLKRIDECCNSYRGDGKCEMMLGVIAEKSQELAEVLNSFADTVKALAPTNQVVGNEIAGFGSSAQHTPTFYTSAAGTVEVVSAPEFCSAEAFSPGSHSVSVTNSALKMMKSRKKAKARQRDRKSKKPQVLPQMMKTEEDGKIPDDGYSWRKYGSKNIKTAIYKKAYYRCNAPCSRNKSRKCQAKKTVQQANSDPTVLQVAYDAPHSCTLALEMEDGPSQDDDHELGRAENLVEQMLSSANAGLVSPSQTTEWVLTDHFRVLRTTSGNFSAVCEEAIQGGSDALANLTKDCGLVSTGDPLGLSRELSDLQNINIDMMGSGLDDWATGMQTNSQESKALQCERRYVNSDSLQDIIEQKLLMDSILHRELHEPDSYYRNPIADIHNWHSYSN